MTDKMFIIVLFTIDGEEIWADSDCTPTVFRSQERAIAYLEGIAESVKKEWPATTFSVIRPIESDAIWERRYVIDTNDGNCCFSYAIRELEYHD